MDGRTPVPGSLRLAGRERPIPTLSTGLTAAALQDHLTRQLSLSLSHPLPTPHKTHCPRRTPSKKRTAANREGERERVLDPSPPPLSLAEKLGLVPRPHPQLSSSQWEQVKTTSRGRQDSAQPCPICQEDFGTRQQVS